MNRRRQPPAFQWRTLSVLCVLTVHLGCCDAHRTRTESLPVLFPDDSEDGGGITPRTRDGASRVGDSSQTITGIPDSLLFRMRNVRNLTDFVSQFLDGYNDLTFQDSDEHAGVEGKRKPTAVNVPDPEPGTCMPTKQLIEFPKPSDPTIILWPPCTRVLRCGGCCPSAVLSCAPVATSNITYKVIKAQYPRPGADKFNFQGHEFVTLERHDRCGCECKQRPSDCNTLQRYEECRCVCTNTLEMQRCDGPDRVWDHTVCRCMCKDYSECSTGFYYNARSCRCEVLYRSRIGSRVLPLPQLRSPYADNRESEQTRNHFLDMPAQEDVLGRYPSLQPQRRTTRMTQPASSTTLSTWRSGTRT